ncbi:MAG: extracellular solute-binding protein [Clostridia bacterium]|nr:extracellular solute-binding protein [Clostridia bacterium]
MATIKDVARLANVSTTTVSNILNNKGNVSEEVYKKVLSVIDELNYNPNFLASNLKTNKTKLIAVILPEMDGLHSQIFKGIQSVLDEKGYYTIVRTTDNSGYRENTMITELVNMRVNAIMAVSTSAEDMSKYEWAAAKNIPIVFLARCFPASEQNAVVFDNYSLVSDWVKETIERVGTPEATQGVALVTCKRNFSDELECQKAFCSGLKERGIKSEPVLFRVDVNSELAFRDIVRCLTGLTAVLRYFLATSESIALVLDEALDALGLTGEITCLTGNRWLRETDRGGLRYIRRDAIGLGRAGAQLLLEHIKSPLVFEKKKIVIESQKPERHAALAPVAGGRKTLRVLMEESPISDAVILLYQNFTKDTGIRIDYEKTGNSNLYEIITDESRRAEFDVCMIDYPWIHSLIERNCLMDLGAFVHDGSEWMPGNVIDSVKSRFLDGGSPLYAVPFMATVQFLFYRHDLFKDRDLQWLFFKKYGIPLSPPKNWTEFEIIAEFFTRACNPESPVEYGTAIDGKEPIGFISEFLPRQWGFKGRIMSAGREVVIDSVENRRALNNLCNTYRFSPKESIDNRWKYERDLFLKGEIAMLMTYATHLPPSSIERYGIDYNNFRIAGIPGNSPILGGWYFGISSNSEAPREGVAFLKWITGSRFAIYNTLLGGLVPQKCITENTQLEFCFPWLRNISGNLAAGRKREIIRNRKGEVIDAHIIDEIMARGIRMAITKEESVENSLSIIKSGLEKCIEGNGRN